MSQQRNKGNQTPKKSNAQEAAKPKGAFNMVLSPEVASKTSGWSIVPSPEGKSKTSKIDEAKKSGKAEGIQKGPLRL